ncbi:MAG: hypothetical protein M3Q44_03640 [bacterium]|nr:hypothetical protein [bacterium]
MNRPNTVGIDYRHITPSNPGLGLHVIAHELTHAITCLRASHLRCVDTSGENSPYFAKIDQIIGGYSNIHENIFDKANHLLRNYDEQTITDIFLTDQAKLLERGFKLDPDNPLLIKKLFVYASIRRSYSEAGQTHALTSLAEIYLHGREVFNFLTEFFDSKTVDELYKFTKSDIFKGHEYLHYPL